MTFHSTQIRLNQADLHGSVPDSGVFILHSTFINEKDALKAEAVPAGRNLPMPVPPS